MSDRVSRLLRISRIASIVATSQHQWEAPTSRRKNWRRKLKDGGYEYREFPPDNFYPKKDDIKEGKRITYKKYVKLDRVKLQDVLNKGHFTLISAGKNPRDEKEKELEKDDEFFHKRHEQLRADIEKAGLSYTEVLGNYDGLENTFLVFHDDTELTPKSAKSMMVHHKDENEAKEHRKLLTELGTKYNQESILTRTAGRTDMVFTTGEKAGITCGGEEWKEVPDYKNYYTDIPVGEKDCSRISFDIHECFERGLM